MFRHVADSFARMGASIEIGALPARRVASYDLNVVGRGRDEHFRLLLRPGVVPAIQHTDAAIRHLVMRVDGDRFLCGHDERHWFAAGVTGHGIVTVADAKRSLLPTTLREAVDQRALHSRRNQTFVRQGEWFFLPTDRTFDGVPIHRREPLLRDRGGKPHIVDELVRFGGQAVVLVGRTEFTPAQFDALVASGDRRVRGRAQRLMKDPEVYVRGRVRHPDHATIVLPHWHRVVVNGEWRGAAGLSFYD